MSAFGWGVIVGPFIWAAVALVVVLVIGALQMATKTSKYGTSCHVDGCMYFEDGEHSELRIYLAGWWHRHIRSKQRWHKIAWAVHPRNPENW